MSEKKGDGMVQSVQHLFEILDVLQEQEGAGVTEIAEQVDMARGSVHKHLKTLKHHDYIRQGTEREYRLGFKFLTRGGYVRDQSDLCRRARPLTQKLAERTDEPANFIIKDGAYGYFAYSVNDQYGLRGDVNIGEQFQLHQTAAGKAILSVLSDEVVRSIYNGLELKQRTENTIADPDALFEELDTIRERGYALNQEEFHDGVIGVGAPVQHADTDAIGAFSVAGPVTQIEEITGQEYINAVVELANRLELQTQYRGR